MTQRVLIIAIIMFITVCGIGFSVHEEELPTLEETIAELILNPDMEFEMKDTGSYSLWKHTNGNWQYGVQPGDTVTFVRKFTCDRIFDSLAPYDFNVEYMADAAPYEFKKYIVSGFEQIGVPRYSKSFFDNSEKITLVDIENGKGFNEKKLWQGETVEGWTFYIPARITWKYRYQIPRDLAAEHLRASAERFVPGDTVRFDWDFVNHGQQAIEGSEPEVWAHLLINGEQVKAWRVEALPAVRQELNEAGELVYIPQYRPFSYHYTVPESYTESALSFEVRINMVPEEQRHMVEEDYDNNTADIRLNSNQWDFAITRLTASAFRPGEPTVGTFTIQNMTDRSYDGLIPFEVKLDTQLIESGFLRDMAPGEQRTLSFRNEGGIGAGSHTVRAEVNPYRTIDESSYSNNVRTTRLGVIQNAPVCKSPNTHAEGVYYMAKGGVDKGGSVIKTYREPIRDEEGHITGYRIIGYDKAWHADLSVTPGFSTKTLKSGHGFQCRVNVSISTNLKEGYYNLPSVAELHGDSGVTVFQKISGDSAGGVYELARSGPLQERKHFIPVSRKDGPYTAKLCFAGATTLGEELAWQKDFPLTVKGHMYMDDVTQ